MRTRPHQTLTNRNRNHQDNSNHSISSSSSIILNTNNNNNIVWASSRDLRLRSQVNSHRRQDWSGLERLQWAPSMPIQIHAISILSIAAPVAVMTISMAATSKHIWSPVHWVASNKCSTMTFDIQSNRFYTICASAPITTLSKFELDTEVWDECRLNWSKMQNM